MSEKARKPLVRAALLMVRAYQCTVGPWLGRACRFAPSCSAYMYTAIERFGLLRGARLGLRRLIQCHPFGASGFDPVPITQRKWT